MNNKINRSRGIISAITCAASLAVCAVAAPADAAEPMGTVNVVEFSRGTLLVQLSSGTNYHGVLTAVAGCTAYNQTADTLKVWQSMAQAALLSGKKLNLYFTACGGFNYITVMDLWN